MHSSVMEWIRAKISGLNLVHSRVLEVGSLNINGSVRELFLRAKSYTGIDFRDGPDVDVVMNAHNLKFLDSQFDLVVSTEMLEHDDEFWVSIKEIGRVLKRGGFLIITARGNGFPLHSYPSDYWRFMPEGFRKLVELAECDVLEISDDPHPDHPGVFAFGVKR